jgi:hypothetical protein
MQQSQPFPQLLHKQVVFVHDGEGLLRGQLSLMLELCKSCLLIGFVRGQELGGKVNHNHNNFKTKCVSTEYNDLAVWQHYLIDDDI